MILLSGKIHICFRKATSCPLVMDTIWILEKYNLSLYHNISAMLNSYLEEIVSLQ